MRISFPSCFDYINYIYIIFMIHIYIIISLIDTNGPQLFEYSDTETQIWRTNYTSHVDFWLQRSVSCSKFNCTYPREKILLKNAGETHIHAHISKESSECGFIKLGSFVFFFFFFQILGGSLKSSHLSSAGGHHRTLHSFPNTEPCQEKPVWIDSWLIK